MSENNSQHAVKYDISLTAVLKVLAVLLGLYFLYYIRDIVLLLIISAILAASLTPLVDWLYNRIKFPRGLTVVLVYILFLGVTGLIIGFLVPELVHDVAGLGQNISEYRDRYASQGSAFFNTLDSLGLSQSLNSLGAMLSGLTSDIFQKTLGVVWGLFDAVTVLVISFYLVIEQNALKDFIKSLTPVAYHSRIGGLVNKVQVKMGKWLLGQLALMASIFVLTYIGLSILGVKYALALALFAGLLEIVPYLGPIISAIPAAFVGLMSSPLQALTVIILYVIVQQAENYLLVPRIIGKSIGANSLVVLVALIVGFKLAGIIGILISAPIVAVVKAIFDDYQGYKSLADEQSVRSG
jgi:predicted PurR-regulated permease PerM